MSRVVGLLLALVGLAVAVAPAAGSHGGPWHTLERVSVSSEGTEGNDGSGQPSLSADGRTVAFHSLASNLVAGDANGTWDSFVRDQLTGTTERVSVSSTGGPPNNMSVYPFLSADGRFVAFHSFATNLVGGDTNGAPDVFVRDRLLGTTQQVSLAASGNQANGGSYTFSPSLSADGRFVAFESDASNLVADDTNGERDAFVYDQQTGNTERVDVSSAGAQANSRGFHPAISADGRYVTFISAASNLVAGVITWYDVFVRDRQTRITEKVSVSSTGEQANANSATVPERDFYVFSFAPITAEGRFVAFNSYASNLVAGDTNDTADVFVRDRLLGTTERVSISSSGAEGNDGSYRPALSADGRFVAFVSYASNLVAGDANGTWDVFVRDRQTGTTERASLSSASTEGNSASQRPSLSADGRTVVFDSEASNLVVGDTNGFQDIFVAQREEGPNTPPVGTAVAPDRILYTHRTWTLQVALFTDPDAGDTHTATVAWGDGTITPGVVDEQVGTVTGSHRYAAPGTYTVTVTVTDQAGASAEGSFQVVVRPHPRLPQ